MKGPRWAGKQVKRLVGCFDLIFACSLQSFSGDPITSPHLPWILVEPLWVLQGTVRLRPRFRAFPKRARRATTAASLERFPAPVDRHTCVQCAGRVDLMVLKFQGKPSSRDGRSQAVWESPIPCRTVGGGTAILHTRLCSLVAALLQYGAGSSL